MTDRIDPGRPLTTREKCAAYMQTDEFRERCEGKPLSKLAAEVENARAERDHFKARAERAEEALRRIAGMDYRGATRAINVAREALAAVQEATDD